MPANLTPQYQKAERDFRRAQTIDERVACLRRMLQLIPRHKGTEKLQADLKTRLSHLTAEQTAERDRPRSSNTGFRFPRQGAGRVVVIGAPNSGKSRLITELTSATPEVANYPFTTREPVPAMMPVLDVSLQLIDTPPIMEGHVEPWLVSLVRTADAAILTFDGSNDTAVQETIEVIAQLATRNTQLSDETGLDPIDLTVARICTLLLATHGSDSEVTTRLELICEQTLSFSGAMIVDLDECSMFDELRRRIYSLLDVIRVYTKRPGETAKYESPFTIPRGGTVEDLAIQVHAERAVRLREARVWYTDSAEPERVGPQQILSDGAMVELHW